jgi:hypothetical protein
MTMNAFEQWLITTLQADLIASGGAPLATLLTNLQAHAGNPALQAADFLAFDAAAPGAGLMFGIEFEQQLLGLAIAKLQTAMAAKAAPAAKPAGVNG